MGAFQFNKGASLCRNSSCGHVQSQSYTDFVRNGAWPLTVSDVYQTVVDVRVFSIFRNIRAHNQRQSCGAFLKSMALEGAHTYGQKAMLPDVAYFLPAYFEYRYMSMDMRVAIQHVNPLQCPACWPNPLSVHFDACMKAFNRKIRQMIHWVAYHEGMLFQPRDVVAEFMKMVDVVMDDFYQRTPRRDGEETATCAHNRVAARDNKSRSRQMLTTGLLAGVCRHQLVLMAVNLSGTGERYALHCLIVALSTIEYGHDITSQDIACLSHPFQERLADAVETTLQLAEEMRALFPDAATDANGARRKLAEQRRSAHPKRHGCTDVDLILRLADSHMADTVMKAREAERKAVALGKPIARPATDLFHAPTHGTMCSQEYSIGNLDGAGWTVGAEAEQAFAHTKDGTHVVARSMSNPVRDDFYTETYITWNFRKWASLPRILTKRLDDAMASLEDATTALKRTADNIGLANCDFVDGEFPKSVPFDLVESTRVAQLPHGSAPTLMLLTRMSSEVKEMARRRKKDSSDRRDDSAAEALRQYFQCVEQLRVAELLKNHLFSGIVSETSSLQAARTMRARLMVVQSFLGMDWLEFHKSVVKAVDKDHIQSLQDKKSMLERKYLLGPDAADQGFQCALDDRIERMQDVVELTCMQRRQKLAKLKEGAGGSHATLLRQRAAADSKSVREALSKMAAMCAHSDKWRPMSGSPQDDGGEPTIDPGPVLDDPPVFPWTSMTADRNAEFPLLHRFGVYPSIKAVDSFKRVLRLREECRIVPEECAKYLKFMEHHEREAAYRVQLFRDEGRMSFGNTGHNNEARYVGHGLMYLLRAEEDRVARARASDVAASSPGVGGTARDDTTPPRRRHEAGDLRAGVMATLVSARATFLDYLLRALETFGKHDGLRHVCLESTYCSHTRRRHATQLDCDDYDDDDNGGYGADSVPDDILRDLGVEGIADVDGSDDESLHSGETEAPGCRGSGCGDEGGAADAPEYRRTNRKRPASPHITMSS
mmetsp:Transcript_6469/g.16972  ORF Transcript_6469/g.16972 Transcript_6469/m.16972 type:complete len:1000 (-) Transcript_6469:153-3152(-)